MTKVQTNHLREWVLDSGVDQEIAELNVMSVSAREARALLNWQGNDKDIDPLVDGWWCNSVEPMTGEVANFGQFKPDKPFIYEGKKRVAKYLSPKGVGTEAIYLAMPDKNYWKGVIDNIDIPVIVTEGAKKAGVGLSLGYPTIALVGVWNGQQAKGRELIDSLKIFAQPGREFIFAFDADLIVKMQVKAALEQLAQLTVSRGCPVKVAQWSLTEGKGLDDLYVLQGEEALHSVISNAISYDEWSAEDTENLPGAQTSQGKVWNYIATVLSKKLEMDEFSLDYRLGGKNLVVPALQAKMSEYAGENVARGYMVEAIHHFAKQNPYNDVREYLKDVGERQPDAGGYIRQLVEMMGLRRDIEKLLVFKWLVAAVSRAMKPGCFFDSVLIQKSREGLGKTKMMQALAGDQRFYEVTAEPSNKDFRQLTVGFWILELGEIEATFRKADISALKSYITQTTDAFRPPYLARLEKFPRHFIFCGSTNSDIVITDPEGVRRWWVVEPTLEFDLDWVTKNRNGIWAEAYRHFLRDEPIFLDPQQKEVFKASAQEHRQTKDFYDGLLPILPELKKAPFKSVDVLVNKFQIMPGTKGYKSKQMDLAQDLKLLGFECRQCRIGGEKGFYWHYTGAINAESDTKLYLPF